MTDTAGNNPREFSHIPVMLGECIDALNIKPNGIYVDGTCGGGGHSEKIAERLTDGGRLFCFDRDGDAIVAAGARLARFTESGRVTMIHDNFAAMKTRLEILGVCEESVDGILLDLGVSSYQLDCGERGFSYNTDAPLDMRMDKESGFSAYDVINEYSEAKLKDILYRYGEERFSPRIAANIVRAREKKRIETTGELVDIIKSSIPTAARDGGHHPAKRSFQAIRIEVNGELDVIAPTIKNAAPLLATGGRIAVITFHSLEDRAVKQTYAALAEGCTCPRDFPVCVCGKKPILKVINKKPIEAAEAELEINPRSRSAKLRVAEKL